jgi:hypothetical protein
MTHDYSVSGNLYVAVCVPDGNERCGTVISSDSGRDISESVRLCDGLPLIVSGQ